MTTDIKYMPLDFQQLLSDCKTEGVGLSLSGENLSVKSSSEVIPDNILNTLRTHKAEIVDLLKKVGSNQVELGRIKTNNLSEAELSPIQNSMWMATKVAEQTELLNFCASTEVFGELDINALQKAINETVSRHKPLFSSIYEDERGGSKQQITQYECELETEAISDEEQFDALLNTLAKQSFDMRQGLKIRFYLVKRKANLFNLVIVTHHIVTDGWSVGILFKEISEHYNKYCTYSDAKAASVAGPDAPDYFDYACWYGDYLKGEAYQQSLKYWKQRLKGAPLLHGIPLDHQRPAVQSFNTRQLKVTLDNASLAQLKSFANEQSVSLYVLLISCLALLVSRYSREADVVVGTTVANRPREEFYSLIGLFVNVLAVRFQCDPHLTFNEFMASVQRNYLGDMENQAVPFDKVVGEVAQNFRSLSFPPLVQIMFSLQNIESADLQLGSAQCNTDYIDTGFSQYDITLLALEKEDGLQFDWRFATDLFEFSSIERMASHFVTLLQEIVKQQNDKCGRVNYLGAQEKDFLLSELSSRRQFRENNIDVNREKGRFNEPFLYEEISSHAELKPTSTALVFGDEMISYGELDRKSSQLAQYLVKTIEAKPEKLVGVCLDRSPELFIVIVAIWKSGAAYVPLKPQYPEARLDYIIDDAAIDCIVTTGSCQKAISKHAEKSILLDQLPDVFENEPAEIISLPVLNTSIDNLAYVIYTSGSTGKPKGVLVPHRGLVNLAKSNIAQFDVDEAARFIQFASISFDAAISEMVTAFYAGCTMHIVPDALVRSPAELGGFIEKKKITHAILPPAILPQLDERQCKSLTSLTVAGEACPVELAKNWSENRRFTNSYGPTETTVCATNGGYNAESESVVIGRPMPNTYCYVVDEFFNPLPVGVAGELCVGGIGVARGYLGMEKKTQASFIQDPFSSTLTDRLYKTGDVVRWLSDGNLEYIGRRDNQVKIRGFRIELDEVAAILSKFAQVEQVALFVDGDRVDQKRLIACIVLSVSDEAADAVKSQLLESLHKQLPGFMVPSLLAVVKEIPLTSHGKTDYRRLGEMIDGNTHLKDETPDSRHAVLLADIWKEELAVSNVNLSDNFFDLGGHSLMAANVVRKTNESLNLSITLKLLFEYPVLEQFAGAIEKMAPNKASSVEGIYSSDRALQTEETEVFEV